MYIRIYLNREIALSKPNSNFSSVSLNMSPPNLEPQLYYWIVIQIPDRTAMQYHISKQIANFIKTNGTWSNFLLFLNHNHITHKKNICTTEVNSF